MNAWIITIGDEILTGRVLNWNAYWIAKRLTSIGIIVNRIVCIPDDVDTIASIVREAINTSVSYIFTTGGLGPTPGDITLLGISRATDKKLVLSEKALSYIRSRYEELYRLGLVRSSEINEYREKMAYVPEGSKVVYNEIGAAPGVILKHENSTIICLPGVPSEAMYILEKILPRIATETNLEVVEDYINIADESVVAGILRELQDKYPNVYIKTYPLGFGQKKMRVISMGKNREMVYEALRFLKKKTEGD